MASSHVNRTQRPNTWLHRPSLRRENSPCQLGAVHTWPNPEVAPPKPRGISVPPQNTTQTGDAGEVRAKLNMATRRT